MRNDVESFKRTYRLLCVNFVRLLRRLNLLQQNNQASLNRLKVGYKPIIGMTLLWRLTHDLAPPKRATMLRRMSHKKPLEPLIPLDDLKKVVAQIAHVPKDAVEKIVPERPKRKRQPKKP